MPNRLTQQKTTQHLTALDGFFMLGYFITRLILPRPSLIFCTIIYPNPAICWGSFLTHNLHNIMQYRRANVPGACYFFTVLIVPEFDHQADYESGHRFSCLT